MGHHALAGILCLCLNFFSFNQQLNCLGKVKEAQKICGSIFLYMKVTFPGTPGRSVSSLTRKGPVIQKRLGTTGLGIKMDRITVVEQTELFLSDLKYVFVEQ